MPVKGKSTLLRVTDPKCHVRIGLPDWRMGSGCTNLISVVVEKPWRCCSRVGSTTGFHLP